MAVIYRTTGVWGAGKGSNLTAAEVDGNFYDHELRIDVLETSRPQPDDFASVAAVGTQLTFYLQSGTTLGPVTLPTLVWQWRGEWLPFTMYAALDTVSVEGQGIFLVLVDHTSAATFDPDLSGGSPPQAVYQQLIGVGTNAVLDDLADVDVTGAAANAMLVAVSSGSPAVITWEDRTPAQVTALLDTFSGDAGAGGAKGLVPVPAAGDAAANKFLRSSGSWANPTISEIGGLGANVAAFLAGPSSANLAAAVTGETGSGALVFGTGPTIAAPVLSGTVTGTYTLGGTPTFSGGTLSGTTTLTGMTAGSVLFVGAGAALSQDNANIFWDDSNNRLGIGTANPTVRLDIRSAAAGIQLVMSDETLDATAKFARVGFAHYTNTEEPVASFLGQSNSTTSILHVGGGTGVLNAVTQVRLYAAANNTTVTGTVMMGVDALVTAFGPLPAGAFTSAFPALKRNATVLEHRLADDSAYGPMAASQLRQYGGENGQFCNILSKTELTTIAAAATTDTTITIPPNCRVIAVSTRVTAAIPTATSFDVGIAGAPARFATGVSTALNTTSPGVLGSMDDDYAAAIAVRITPNLTPANNTGRVRVTIHYIEITPPTS